MFRAKNLLRACVTIEGNELKWVVPISSPTRSKSFELFTVIYKFPSAYFKFDR